MSLKKNIFLILFIFIAQASFSQKQLVILRNGVVQASFKEGEYIRFVLRNHRHAEGHIVELYDFYMITSNDTVQLKDILKMDIRNHRGPRSWTSRVVGGLLLAGGLVYFGVDQGNVALNINSQNTTPVEWVAPLAAAGVGASLLLIRPRYKRLNGIRFLQTVDYTSPFYQR
jgi:hypothetical protein